MGDRLTPSLLRQICDELAATISDQGFAKVEQVRGRLNLDPTPLSIDIYPADPMTDDRPRGFGPPFGAYVLTVRARVGGADHEAAQDALLDLMDWHDGLANVLEDDQTLNGLASSVSVAGPTGLRPYRGKGDEILMGCEWSVNVIPAES